MTKTWKYRMHLVYPKHQVQPTPVLLSGKSHGWRRLVGCSTWGRWELDTTELLHIHFALSCIGEGNGTLLQYSCLENPRDGDPGGLLSMRSHRVGHEWSDLAAVAANTKSLKTYGRRGFGWEGQGTEVAEHTLLVSTRLQPDPRGSGVKVSLQWPHQGDRGICIWPQEGEFQSPQLRTLQPFRVGEGGTTTPQKSLQKSMDYKTHLGAETQISFYNDLLAFFFFLRFFWCGRFLMSLFNLLQYCFCFMFWFLGPKACGILTPWPGFELVSSALKGGVLTSGPPGKYHHCIHF